MEVVDRAVETTAKGGRVYKVTNSNSAFGPRAEAWSKLTHGDMCAVLEGARTCTALRLNSCLFVNHMPTSRGRSAS